MPVDKETRQKPLRTMARWDYLENMKETGCCLSCLSNWMHTLGGTKLKSLGSGLGLVHPFAVNVILNK